MIKYPGTTTIPAIKRHIDLHTLKTLCGFFQSMSGLLRVFPDNKSRYARGTMKTMNNEILLGTLGSLLAMSVGWFSREIYGKIIQSIVDKATYKNALIEGEWQSRVTFPDDNFNVFEIKIIRLGYRVKGEVRCVDGYSKGHNFEIKGEFTPPLLILVYRALSTYSTEKGSATLFLSKNGNEFRGQMAYSDGVQEGIFATELVMTRATSKFAW